MRLFTLLFLSLIAIVSCGKKVKVPEGVLPPEKITPVLWDLMRADEMVSSTARPDSILLQQQKNVSVYQQVLKIHGTDQKTFRQSLDYYQRNPEVFKIVLDSLQRRSDSAIIRKMNKPS